MRLFTLITTSLAFVGSAIAASPSTLDNLFSNVKARDAAVHGTVDAYRTGAVSLDQVRTYIRGNSSAIASLITDFKDAFAAQLPSNNTGGGNSHERRANTDAGLDPEGQVSAFLALVKGAVDAIIDDVNATNSYVNGQTGLEGPDPVGAAVYFIQEQLIVLVGITFFAGLFVAEILTEPLRNLPQFPSFPF